MALHAEKADPVTAASMISFELMARQAMQGLLYSVMDCWGLGLAES
jgi:hypothetical protein